MVFSSSEKWKEWGVWLKPFFEVDYILRYTFLALLNENQLISLMKTADQSVISTLPILGVIAGVEYTITMNNKDEKVTD